MTESIALMNRSRRALLSTVVGGGTQLPPEALRVLATVPAWWARRARAAGVAGRGADLDHTLGLLPDLERAGVDELRVRSDLLDVSGEALGQAYVRELLPSVRSAGGRFYTPPLLAAALYDQGVAALHGEPDGLVFDPAAGAGALLLPALRSWLRREAGTQPEMILARGRTAVGGRDLDPAAAWLGSVVLAAELLPVWGQVRARRRHRLPELVTVGDGLAGLPGGAAMTLLNPPYGRIRLTEADRERWAHALYGHANLYVLFLAAALEQTRPGGVISALIPSSWLGGAYFQRLRHLLADEAPLARLTRVTDRGGVFDGVLQETVLATFRCGARRDPVLCDVLTLNGRTVRSSIGRARIARPSDQPWLLPRGADDGPLVAAAARMPDRLSTLGWSVSTGPMVWNRHRPLLSRTPRERCVRVVWAADLDGGRLHRDTGRDAMRWVRLCDDRTEAVFVLDRPAVLVARTSAPEQTRRLIVATLDDRRLAEWGGRVVVENHVNVLTPAPGTRMSPRVLTALLDSEPLDRLFRCLTGSVAVSAYELSALPLPAGEMLASWETLDDDALGCAIQAAYGMTG